MTVSIKQSMIGAGLGCFGFGISDAIYGGYQYAKAKPVLEECACAYIGDAEQNIAKAKKTFKDGALLTITGIAIIALSHFSLSDS